MNGCKKYFVLLFSILALATAGCQKKEVAGQRKPAAANRVFSDPTTIQLADAITANDMAQVQALIAARADVNASGQAGINLLQWAIVKRNVAAYEALLRAGADPTQTDARGDTVMHDAARLQDSAYLDALLARRVDPNVRNAVSGYTPLMDAVIARREDRLRQLLGAGGNPNLWDRGGDTALHLAAKLNAGQLVLVLLEAGADPRAVNRQGATFQGYFYMTPEDVLSTDGHQQREAVRNWLSAHNVPIEGEPAAAR